MGVGFAYKKLLDVIGGESPEGFRLFKLGILNPLPRNVIANFLSECQEILVIEEIEPFVEAQLKSIAYDNACTAKIFGKQSQHLSREGELFRWQIQGALKEFIPEFVPKHNYTHEKEPEERPEKEDHCDGCQYDLILDKLEEAAESVGQKPALVGDPGCLVTVAGRLDAKYAIGSAVGVADGLSKAGIDERAVAIFGDSAFFHTALPAICNAVHNRSNILLVVLDNKATATSGFQPHPGVPKDAMGQIAPACDIARIAHACGVKKVHTVGPHDLDSRLKDVFTEALSQNEIALLIVQIESHKQPGFDDSP
ncbi:MAG: thiamine pyrophosphate-dependent enzyme [Candidatus Aminicenantales bacterium]